MRRRNGSSFAKFLTVFAVLFGLGLGLCGLSMILPSSDQEFHTNWLSLPSVLLMVLSLLGLVGTLVVRVIAIALGRFSPDKQDHQ
ncbi:MAG TPA: hypothetical protein VG267_17540 [Terracidiphilus sp.]|jgi:hypothetical protein|nr:hypothetical protein [Terracidiphilus sp.]